MKKNMKRFSVLLLTLSLLFALCGCDALDEMRQRQAFVNEDGTITWQGNIYKKLPYDEFLRPETNYDNYISVTQPDVPVLLADGFSEITCFATEDKQFLRSTDYGETYYYCIASSYDEICDRIWKPFVPEIVCYDYTWYNEEANEYETKTYTLTQEQVDAIELIIENEKPTELSDGMYLDTRSTIYLEECTKDRIFRRSTVNISLSANGNTYYMTLITGDESVLFTVPSGCNDIFSDIYKAYNEAEYAYDDLFEDVVI